MEAAGRPLQSSSPSDQSSRGHSLIRGSVLRVAGLAVQVVISFVLTPLVVQSLGDRNYGLWLLVGSFLFYFGLMDFGLSSAAARFVTRCLAQGRPQDEKEYIDTAIIVFAFLSLGTILLGLVVIALAPLIVVVEVVDLFRLLIVITTIGIAVNLPFRVFYGILKARLRYDTMSSVSIVAGITKGLLIYGFLSRGFGVLTLAVISAATMTIETAMIYWYSSSFGVFSWHSIQYKSARIRELFSYSSYAFTANIAELMITRIDSLVITLFLNLERVTPYGLALSIIRYGHDFTAAILGTLDPVFSQEEGRGDFENMRRILLLTSKISVMLCTMTFAATAIYGHDFIVRWIGKDYEGLQGVIVWLSLAMLAPAAQRPSISLLYGISRHSLYAWMTIVEGIANLLITIVLVQSFDIVGVAIGSAIPAVILKLVILPFYICRVAGIPSSRFFVDFVLRGLFLCAVINGLFFWIIVRRYLEPEYLRIALLAGAQMVVVTAVSWYTVFTPDERRYLLGHLRHKIV